MKQKRVRNAHEEVKWAEISIRAPSTPRNASAAATSSKADRMWTGAVGRLRRIVPWSEKGAGKVPSEVFAKVRKGGLRLLGRGSVRRWRAVRAF